MQTKFKLYKVDMKYIRNLHHIDDRVLSVSPQTGKDTRVFVGIVIVCGTHKYCIPLSSPKDKHKRMRNSMDFSKIEVDGKLLGVLNFNLMIPIEEAQLQPIDLIVRRRDRSEIIRYKELCQKELEWCHRHSEVICNNANVLYGCHRQHVRRQDSAIYQKYLPARSAVRQGCNRRYRYSQRFRLAP